MWLKILILILIVWLLTALLLYYSEQSEPRPAFLQNLRYPNSTNDCDVIQKNLRNRIVTSLDDEDHPLNRRIDDQINELCEKVRTTQADDKEVQAMSQKLLCLWHEKMNRIRGLAAARLAGQEVPKDRRAHKEANRHPSGQ